MQDEEKVVPYEDEVDIDGRPKTRKLSGDPLAAGDPQETDDDPTKDEETSATPSVSADEDEAPEKASETLTEPWPRPR
jgi:hypothetical protein